MTIDLKPCPFCGGKAIEIWFENGHYQIGCNNGENFGCNIRGPIMFNRADAIKVWNNRPGEISPAISSAQCIENLRTRKEEIVETLSKLMYWMDKAREGQEIDLEKFNVVWKECEEVVNHG